MIELPLYLYVVYCFAFGMTFFVIGNIVLSSFFKEGVAGISANLRVEPSEECDASVPR